MVATSGGDVRVRGVPVRNLVTFVTAELSPGQLKNVYAQLKPDEASHLSGMILATDEFPLALVNRFTELAAQAKGEDAFRFGYRAGHMSAEQSLTGAHRMILLITTPEYALKNAPLLWTRIYTGGEIVTEQRPDGALVRASSFPGNNAGCGRITGFFEVIAQRVKKGSQTSHSSCAARGDKACEWSFRWK